PEVVHRDGLVVVGDAVHGRDAHVPVGLVVAVVVGVLQRVLEAFGGLGGEVAHVLSGAAEVERHDRPGVGRQPGGGGPVDEAGVGAALPGADGDVRLDAGVVRLHGLECVHGALLHGGVAVGVGLDVDVDRLEAVGVDDLLVGGGEFARAGAG